MVCLNTPLKINDSDLTNCDKDLIDMEDVTMDDDNNSGDGLRIRRIAGGSIINYPPYFTPDGENLFIIFKNIIHVYSTTTGEWLRDLEGPKDEIIGIQYDLLNSKLLTACTKSGKIFRWKYKTGNIEDKFEIIQQKCNITNFYFVNIWQNSSCALITYTLPDSKFVNWTILDITNGKKLRCEVQINLDENKVLASVENKNFHYFVLVQNHFLYIVDYKNWHFIRWNNAQRVPITCVRCHPTEEMIATGDEMGRIFVWRQFWDKRNLYTTLFHWHHTPVTSISFTESGTGFYSSGKEAVLVKWNIQNPANKDFLPRMSSHIAHIAVSEENRKIAVCTADNGIQILGAQHQMNCILQNFTYVADDKTDLNKFPVGLRINPRTNTLVLNGRMGCLQFFSTYTKSLLYNIDIVMQNRLSMEAKKVLYDIRVTHADFNVDWMVTGETWDDQEHPAELRLKFWEFNKENQNYVLNTNMELPHEGGFKVIEFSNQDYEENLLCATVGNDNLIKMWALEDSDNIYKKGKVWYCIGQTNYKNLQIDSINFSQDGSLLAAGFGNSLCIYKSDNLKLKTVLTAPAGLDGSLQKVQIILPNNIKTSPSKKSDLLDRRKKVLELFESFLEKNNQDLVTKIKKTKIIKDDKRSSSIKRQQIVNDKQKDILFDKIQSITELDLFQKILLYQKLGISCNLPKEIQKHTIKYLSTNILAIRQKGNKLNSSNIKIRNQFKAKNRLNNYFDNRTYEEYLQNQLVPLMKLLNIDPTNREQIHSNGDTSETKCNGFSNSDNEQKESNEMKQLIPNCNSIKHVLFGAGEYSHLIVVCTENRVLIWNLLTLRIQSVLKLSTNKIFVDPMTSLFAVFTIYNELYIFLPNAPIPLYQRTDLPKIYGAVWMPRQYPKSQSINLDWQAISTLYFLTDKQEIVYLASEKDEDDLSVVGAYMNPAQEITRYSTFGAFAMNQIKSKNDRKNQGLSTTIGVPGKSFVKSLTELSSHAMAPANLLCSEFLKSFLLNDFNPNKINSEEVECISIEDEDEKNSDSEEFGNRINKKKSNLKIIETKINKIEIDDHIKDEIRLENILKEKIEIQFK